MGMALAFTLSCTKENAAFLQPTPQLIGGSTPDYEYFEPAGDLETAIRDALVYLEDDQALDTVNLTKAIWVLETGINYLFGDEVYIFEDQHVDSLSYQIDFTHTDVIEERDLKSTLINLHGLIATKLSTTDGYAFTGVNVYVKEKTGSMVSLGVKVAYLTGVTGSIGEPESSGCSIPSSDGDRLAYPPEYCNNDPASTARKHAADRALVCLRKYWGPDPYAPPYNRKYYTNVINYSSIHTTAVFISPNQLLGHSGSPFSAHEEPVSFNTCVTIAQQNTYASIIYSQVSTLLNKPFGVINLTMGAEIHTGNLCDWQYNSVFIGENGWINNSPLTLSYL